MPEKEIISVERIVKEKNPRLFRWIPRFIFTAFKRLILQDKVNKILFDNRDKSSIEFASNLVKEAGVTPVIHYQTELDPDKNYIFACNHPLGGLDAFSFAVKLYEKRKKFKFIVNDILMHLKGLDSLFIPVNKHGKQGRAYAKIMDEAYCSDNAIIIFPAGLVSRKQKGKISDLKWHKNFVQKAIQYQRDIVPVHIIAQNSSFFYNFALWRKRLGIKANIEMLFLSREFFNFNQKHIHIVVGKPIPYQELKTGLDRQAWADKIKAITYQLHPDESKD